jgi:hypothetical protein
MIGPYRSSDQYVRSTASRHGPRKLRFLKMSEQWLIEIRHKCNNDVVPCDATAQQQRKASPRVLIQRPMKIE